MALFVDVNTATDNPVIGIRSFGADTALVARHTVAAVHGLQSAGVAACAKHFPGHGAPARTLTGWSRSRRPWTAAPPRAGAVPRRHRGRDKG